MGRLRVRLGRIWALLREGVERGVFPGAVAAIFLPGSLYLSAAGWRALYSHREPNDTETLYDLASLTKPLATTLALMKLRAEGRISLSAPLKCFFPEEFFGNDTFREISLREVLSHGAGFPAWRPYFRKLQERPLRERREALVRLILSETQAYQPGERELYSDLGFFLLGEVIVRITRTPLERYVENVYGELGIPELLFRPLHKGIPRERIAPTEFLPSAGVFLRGEVHDENTRALGGVSGTAGLFGTARGVARLLSVFLEVWQGGKRGFLTRELLEEFWCFRRPGGTWALGFDRPSPTGSSAGPLFPRRALGHLGYTGCAFWLVPEEGWGAVLLTNRVHPSRENRRIRSFRPRFFSEVAIRMRRGTP
ncbi:serine hydrolase [Thermosulfurimonas sp. F29]|uniref:serine hydrolase domain-containing protein n=1 Tax=Thermosulfurimonas sp. F29 TaxID=2867247 RepID=UPI001C82EF8A|nr:serine hydrolase domain-containing protein [Thermosulfurimonas sp. F29]MBX6422336.1 beta-lactamase family protein [Thermosulfurimonas sp. F29]